MAFHELQEPVFPLRPQAAAGECKKTESHDAAHDKSYVYTNQNKQSGRGYLDVDQRKGNC